MKFKYTIEETRIYTVTADADSLEEARQLYMYSEIADLKERTMSSDYKLVSLEEIV